MNIQVDTSSPVPPYEQLRSQIGAMVASGALPEGTRLPPIRQLAGDLGLAINTVGRAYHELEAEGVVQTRGRHGTIVTGSVASNGKERKKMVEQAAEVFVRHAQHQGAELDEVLDAVRRAYEDVARQGTPLDGKRGR